MNRGNYSIKLVTYLICIITLIPLFIIIAASLTKTSYIKFPPQGLTLNWYLEAIHNTNLMRALGISFQVGIIASVISSIFGIIGGLYLSKSGRLFAKALTSFFLAPLTLPIIVFAISILFFFSSLGLVRTITGLIISHAVLTMPYSIRMISAAVSRDMYRWEQAAAVLGANPIQVFTRVTFPSIRAGVMSGMMFAFLVSLNNVTAALFIVGVRTTTYPILLFQMTKERISPDAAALSSILVFFTFFMMVLLEKKYGFYRILEQRRIR